MTNKKRGGKNNKKKQQPFVSICTPTYNRRPFITHMIKCFEHQTYPKNRMEWIIVDDGTDKIEDMVKDIPQVKYFKYDKKMSLGKKRNLMHTKTSGEIIVYMDDDDYYPPNRISHAVKMLQTHPSALCAGCSEIYIYFKHINKIIKFGPYGEKHATAGTFAFRRKLLDDHTYENNAALAEEKAFLKNYTVPLVQLDPFQTILVFSHEHNTFDKKKLLDNPNPLFVHETDKKVDMFVKDPAIRDFYMNKIVDLLKDYEPGRPTMKPDVLKQIIEIEEKRRKEAERIAQNIANENNKCIMIKQNDGVPKKLSIEQVMQLLQQQQNQINTLSQQLKGKDIEIKMIEESYKNQLQENNNSDNNKDTRCIILTNNDGSQMPLSLEQVATVLKNQKDHILTMNNILKDKDTEIEELRKKLEHAENKIEIMKNILPLQEEENVFLKIIEHDKEENKVIESETDKAIPVFNNPIPMATIVEDKVAEVEEGAPA